MNMEHITDGAKNKHSARRKLGAFFVVLSVYIQMDMVT